MDQQSNVIDYTQYPDAKGHFGIHGGRFVSETQYKPVAASDSWECTPHHLSRKANVE